MFLLSVLTSRADPEANLDHARTLTRICPHLRRAFRHIRQQNDPTNVGQAAFDALGPGVIVVGEGGGCRRISKLAQSLLEKSRAFSVDLRSKLRASNHDLGAALQTMLRSETSEPKVHETLLLDHGMALRVFPMQIATEGLATYLQGPTVIVLLDPLTGSHDRTRPDIRALHGLAALHHLTRAETEVLQAIASGLTVDQIAQIRGVTLETIRGQIKALFAKTSAKRQAELIRLVLAPNRPKH